MVKNHKPSMYTCTHTPTQCSHILFNICQNCILSELNEIQHSQKKYIFQFHLFQHICNLIMAIKLWMNKVETNNTQSLHFIIFMGVPPKTFFFFFWDRKNQLWWWWWGFPCIPGFWEVLTSKSHPVFSSFFLSGDQLTHQFHFLDNSDLASLDSCGLAFPDQLRMSLFPWYVSTLCLDSIVTPLWLCWVKGATCV